MNITLDDLLKQSQSADDVQISTSEEDLFPKEEGSLTGNPKTEARLLSLQALYEVFLLPEAAQPKKILEIFQNKHIPSREADKTLFTKIFTEATQDVDRYSTLVEANLAEGWTLSRLGVVERCLLVAAAAELTVKPNTPHKVIINEFLNISKGFFKPEGVSFINAVLDKLASKIRK